VIRRGVDKTKRVQKSLVRKCAFHQRLMVDGPPSKTIIVAITLCTITSQCLI